MNLFKLILLIAALILALLATFNVASPKINLLAASLACYYGSVLA